MEERVEIILNETIDPEELQKQTNIYNVAVNNNTIDANITFQYALSLTRSPYFGDNLRAVNLLEDLCTNGLPSAFRDYLYYLIIVNIKIKNYERALACAKKFLSVEPKNRQVLDLKEYIELKQFRKDMKGLAIVGSVAVAAIGAVVAFSVKK